MSISIVGSLKSKR